jgi:hypothetical protein
MLVRHLREAKLMGLGVTVHIAEVHIIVTSTRSN